MSQFTEKPLQQPPTVVNPMAIASFGLSLVALCCAVVAAVPAVTAGGLAILLGFAALHDVGRSNGRMDGHRAAITGILLTLTAGFFYGLLHRPICRLPYIDPQTQSANHLKSIARAMYDFAAKNGNHLPPAAGGPGMHAGLSWRVRLLPHLEQDWLFSKFKLDEPWDSPDNIKLLEFMPREYSIPGCDDPPGMTRFRVFVGDASPFPLTVGPNKDVLGRSIEELGIDRDKTILVVEVGEPVPWTKPDELIYAADLPLPKLGAFFGYIQGVMADGSYGEVPGNTSETELRRMITIRVPVKKR